MMGGGGEETLKNKQGKVHHEVLKWNKVSKARDTFISTFFTISFLGQGCTLLLFLYCI